MTSLDSPTTTATSTLPRRPPIRYYCCGCRSRSAVIIINTFLWIGSIFYIGICIWGLTDTGADAPTDSERVLIQTVLGMMIFQMIISMTGIWGACTYRLWPIQITFAYISIGVAFAVIAMVLSVNPFMLITIALQLYLFWTPQYGYIQDFQQGVFHDEIAAQQQRGGGGGQSKPDYHQTTPITAGSEDATAESGTGYKDNEDDDDDEDGEALEMV